MSQSRILSLESSTSGGLAAALVLGAVGSACTGTLHTDEGRADAASSDVTVDAPDALIEGVEYVPECETAQHGNVPIRLLTPAQYGRALVAAFPALELDADTLTKSLPSPVASAGFSSNAGHAAGQAELMELLDIAEGVAAEVVSEFGTLMDCPLDRGCVERFIDDHGRTLFRGPVPGAERTALLKLFDEAVGDQAGLERVVMGMILSAEVLYQAEAVSEERRPLPSRELASKLSFFVWDSVPDETLLEAAAAGQLDSEEGLRQQTQRMLSDPRAARMVESFFEQWLALPALTAGETTSMNEATVEAVVRESLDFASWVVLDDEGTYPDLLLSQEGFPGPEVADIYGVEPLEAGKGPIELPPERSGLLARAGFLAASSHLTDTAPTIRGQQIRERFLCQSVPSPPADVQEEFPELPDDPSLTKRKKLELHKAPSCTGCHVLLDPIGFGFEAYDEVGRYRTTYENGEPVDDSGEIVPATGRESEFQGTFEGVGGLAELLSSSQAGRDCFAEQWFRFALYRRVSEVDACAFENLRAAFHNSDYSVEELVLGLVQSQAFRFRNPEEL